MASGQRPVVVTRAGRVRGVEEGPVAAFRGIPYAVSPVGELRFTGPRAHPGWSGVRDAAHAGPAVPQEHSRLEAVMGPHALDCDEDGCLNLNVWTPAGALAEGAAPRPVLVWIHGGGFSSGCGGWDWYDGGRLAALGDITVVTVNYRLGPLGYLHLPSIGADNLGSQDQGAALRWVRENIAAFGGDPGLITVGGQSAGGFSSLALATDPATSGMVRRVILQSHAPGLPPQDPADAAEVATAYLRILGADRETDPGRALREVPVAQLLDAYRQLAAGLGRTPGDPAPAMWPVLGGAGAPRTWQQAVADGALDGKDVLTGCTENEMAAFLAFNPDVRAFTREDAIAALGALTARYGGDAVSAYQRCEARRPDGTAAQVFTDVAGDWVFCDGVTELAGRCAAQGTPAYVYRFTRHPDPDEHGLGSAHCAELPFLFGTFDTYPDAPMLGAVSDDDHALARAFGGALATFVATGSPNGTDLAKWHPYGPGPEPEVMRFGPAPH
ncbi:carboxylesterase/lipase family protein [Streptomyces olivoreticuli]